MTKINKANTARYLAYKKIYTWVAKQVHVPPEVSKLIEEADQAENEYHETLLRQVDEYQAEQETLGAMHV